MDARACCFDQLFTTTVLLFFFPRTNNQEELFDQILSGLFEFNSPDWDEISYQAKELISWMLQVDPLQRYSAYEILQHPWIKNGGGGDKGDC